jgi:hypothetical protein
MKQILKNEKVNLILIITLATMNWPKNHFLLLSLSNVKEFLS